MAANGISTLATKQLKQQAKLDLSETKRAAAGNPRSVYDITQLPTQYSGNDVVNNPNSGGLIVGRPWILQLTIINGGAADTDHDPDLHITGGESDTDHDPDLHITGGEA